MNHLLAGLLMVAAAPTSPAVVAAPLGDRERVVEALRAAHELHLDRALALAAHVCDLHLDGQWMPVLDVRELVHGAVTPRGVNRVIVLSPNLQLLRRVEYADQRPLACKGPRVYLSGAISVEGVPGEGNVLVFSEAGRNVRLEHKDINDWPIYPPR